MQSTFDDLYKSDDDKALNGIRVVLGSNPKGGEVAFWIAEVNNPDHEKAQRKRSKRLERTRKREQQKLLTAEIVAEGILKNWEGVLDADGNEMPPTLENKTKALLKYSKLFTDVMDVASDPAFYTEDESIDAEEAERDTEKN